jgi:U3 small nucleolar RNA-associated protein MPP10
MMVLSVVFSFDVQLQRQIAELEQKNIEAKPWQLTGEVFSSARPENSLLQETTEFDYMTRQGKIIIKRNFS